ncbi:MAG TPA: phosphoribosylformylglycinamidine cyclo-ligase [Candidatus Methylomirabilis sp.]|nr:phosphoribosylformylglycinamidine cyclo-ligase [Candidatus Methylomirabilis sp.]HSD51803.1 phosphoribosylformylglycinamidine cyclo-ligase [Candidatus Methylomirabilis sp.]
MSEASYAASGVNTVREEAGLAGLLAWVGKTLEFGRHRSVLEFGYFASVLDLGNGLGLALSTDGVGTKLLVAQMLDKYDTIGIDCVAMNVNDILCVGAEPLCMLDYLAVQEADPDLLEQIGKGLHEGARQANISIPGGEIAQVREIIKGEREGRGFDLAGACIGLVPTNRILVGQDIQPGDAVIGLRSSGIHSNGLTLAREVFFKKATYRPDRYIAELGRTIGEELLMPTRIYVREILELLRAGLEIRALAHITSDGFLNLARVRAKVGYVLEVLPDPQPIFTLLQHIGRVSDEEMFAVYNMGTGFCLVVARAAADRALETLRRLGVEAFHLGHAVADPDRKVHLVPRGLVGAGSHFRRAS